MPLTLLLAEVSMTSLAETAEPISTSCSEVASSAVTSRSTQRSRFTGSERRMRRKTSEFSEFKLPPSLESGGLPTTKEVLEEGEKKIKDCYR